jgi:hypothetical protein
MTQEEKDLLLKDLCGRLPYGVIVKDRNGVHKLTAGNTEFTDLLYNGKCNIKPYLFPFSSMTAEQKREYVRIASGNIATAQLVGMTVQDWFSKNHIDYRGLIPMGLAIDATNKNIY